MKKPAIERRETVLFLDDNPTRRLRAQQKYLGCVTVRSAEGCIALLNREWDRVYLDHDLGGEEGCDPNRTDTGMAVVRWVVAHKPSVRAFVVHSLNHPAATLMTSKLRAAGYSVRQTPFIQEFNAEQVEDSPDAP